MDGRMGECSKAVLVFLIFSSFTLASCVDQLGLASDVVSQPTPIPRPTGRFNDAASMQAFLQRTLPRKTPLAVARHFMEKEGFACSLHKNRPLPGEVAHGHRSNYLICIRKDERLPVSTTWGVYIIVDRDELGVAQIHVNMSLTGL